MVNYKAVLYSPSVSWNECSEKNKRFHEEHIPIEQNPLSIGLRWLVFTGPDVNWVGLTYNYVVD